MSVLTQQFIAQSVSGIGDIVDIDNSLTGLADVNPIRGATFFLFGFTNSIFISAEDTCFFPVGNTPVPLLPPTADPPFPPIWPIHIPTGPIYERDHLSKNLKMIRGDTFIFEIAVILNGVPVDLTGGTLTMTAKWDIIDIDANAVFQISTGSGDIILTDAVNGLATVTIAHGKTTALPSHVCNLVYDIELLNATSEHFTVLTGILSVYPDSTTNT